MRHRGEGVWGPTLVAVAGIAVLIGLGTWQRERLVWKEGLITTLEARLAAEPVSLPDRGAWAGLAAADEFRRVTATVTFLHEEEALVYTAGSSLRRDVSGPGYWVFTPARLAGGAIVMVDRGFAPEGRRDRASRLAGEIAGPVTITGVLRWPEAPGLFTPAANPAANLWFSRDIAGIAAAKGITAMAAVAPFYIDQESPVPPGGSPMPGPLRPMLSNNHFGYMLTWYGLAAALAAVYAVWLTGWWRRARQPSDRPAES